MTKHQRKIKHQERMVIYSKRNLSKHFYMSMLEQLEEGEDLSRYQIGKIGEMAVASHHRFRGWKRMKLANNPYFDFKHKRCDFVFQVKTSAQQKQVQVSVKNHPKALVDLVIVLWIGTEFLFYAIPASVWVYDFNMARQNTVFMKGTTIAAWREQYEEYEV